MRLVYGLLVLILLEVSCDNHWDYFEKSDVAPILELTGPAVKNGNFIKDSLKTNHVYQVPYKLYSSTAVTFTSTQNDSYAFSVDNQVIKITGLTSGDGLILITATDMYKKTCTDSISLTIFDNLTPVAVLNYDILELDGSYTLSLDGTSSADKDQKYGGFITSYNFMVNGVSYISTNPKLKYSVVKGNTYTVHFSVLDDDNASSNEIVTYIKI